MEKFLQAIETSLQNENWYGALALALMLPDVCGSMEDKPYGAKRYINWFETYLSQKYNGFLSGSDCYALRCSFLHEGQDSIEQQRKKDILDKFVFTSKGSSHCNKIKQAGVRDVVYNNKSVLQLSVERFCKDFIDAVKSWVEEMKNNAIVQKNVSAMIKIHENGVSIGMVSIQ